MPVSLHAVPCHPPCRTYHGSLATFACKRKIIELGGRGSARHEAGSVAFVPRFQEKTAPSTAEPFHDPGCLCCGRTDKAEELRHERHYLSGRTRRRNWCGALVPGPALIVFGRWCGALSGSPTPTSPPPTPPPATSPPPAACP